MVRFSWNNWLRQGPADEQRGRRARPLGRFRPRLEAFESRVLPSFTLGGSFAVGAAPASVAVADVNQDGKLDLVTANLGSDSVSVLLGCGSGSFPNRQDFAVGRYPEAVAVADVNGDGQPDLVTASNFSANVSVLLGTGTGSFQNARNFAAGSGPFSVAVADVNADGKLDLMVANPGSNSVSVLLGNRNAATHFELTAPAITAAGNSLAVHMRALTAGNQLDWLYSGTVHFSSSDPQATLPADTAFTLTDGGERTFAGLVLRTPSTQTITATDTVSGSIVGSLVVTVLPASTLSPTSLPAGLAGTAYSQSFSANGGAGGSFRFGVTLGSLPVGLTLSPDGLLSGTPTVAGSSAFTVTATDAGGFTGSGLYTLLVDPGPADHLAFTVPEHLTAGVPFAVLITVQDAFHNTATGYLGTVAFLLAPGGDLGNYTFTASDQGQYTLAGLLLDAGNYTLTGRDLANPAISSSITFSVNLPGAAPPGRSGQGPAPWATAPALLASPADDVWAALFASENPLGPGCWSEGIWVRKHEAIPSRARSAAE
jgi:hypothetical protein